MTNHPARSRRGACFRPTADEIREVQHGLAWSDERCADACCVAVKSWCEWRTGERKMPAGAWRLFRIVAGVLEAGP